MADIDIALKCIKDKNQRYSMLYSYLDGDPTLKFSTERLERAFGQSFVYFAQDWGSVIINAILDRLVLKGFNSDNTQINSVLDDLFSNLNINLDAKDVHEALQVTGEAFLVVDVIDGQPEVYFNDPRLCEVVYDSDRPKVKRFAAKKWKGDDGRIYLTLYYTDRIETYVSDTGNSAKSFSLVEINPNEFGVIPVFHFRNSRRSMKSEFSLSTISVLDAVNKLFGDLMVSAEFEAFKMRVFISQTDPGDVKIGPDMHMWLPANENASGQDTSITEVGGSTLQNFLDPIEKLANVLAVTTRTPRHLFMNTGASMSGEALLVEEAPLTKKVQAKEESYTPTWQEFAVYLLKVKGINANPGEVICVWDNPQIEQPLTKAQTIQTEVAAGIPLKNALQRSGADQTEIDQIFPTTNVNN